MTGIDSLTDIRHICYHGIELKDGNWYKCAKSYILAHCFHIFFSLIVYIYILQKTNHTR